MYQIKELNTDAVRLLQSTGYNYAFNKKTGVFIRWGETWEEDPSYSPVGPEILDIEISVNGCPNACRWCYKGNTNDAPVNMSLETFKTILDKMPSVMQVALGITGTQTNPDFVPIMEYCRSKGVIPNYTLSGIDLTDEIAQATAELCGAVAVSAYERSLDVCYDTVKRFADLGMDQVNIHLLYHANNLPFVKSVLVDAANDSRLHHLNAVVLLGLKPKGNAVNMQPATYEQFAELVEYANALNVPLGFDSCSAHKFLRWARENTTGSVLAHHETVAEPCESGCFSSYVNVEGNFYPCSFSEDLFDPISVLNIEAFDDIWYHKDVVAFRDSLLERGRKCPFYQID